MRIALNLLSLLTAAVVAGCATSTPNSATTQSSPSRVVITPPGQPLPSPPAGTYDINDVEVRPVPIRRTGARYPTELRREGISGGATILIIIDPNGRVTALKVVQATHPAFADAALEAVSQWEFRPALVKGQPVHCQMTVPIDFTTASR